MESQLRAYAWAHFAAAIFTRNVAAKDAANEADSLLAEFDKRDFSDPAEAADRQARETHHLEERLEVVNKAKMLDQVNELTSALQLPNETVAEVVERLVKAFDDK